MYNSIWKTYVKWNKIENVRYSANITGHLSMPQGETDMERLTGTTVRGLIAPIVRSGEDIAVITKDVVVNFLEKSGIEAEDRDIVGITESIVARSQGNYASCSDLADDVKKKIEGRTAGVIFPILSRNRFAICLKGIARGLDKIVLMLSYPSDEVGNHLISSEKFDESGVNPWTDVLTEEKFTEIFGVPKHTFTGVNYLEYYREIIEGENCECEIIFSNNPQSILNYTGEVINCDIHTRVRTRNILKNSGAKTVISMDGLLNEKSDSHGYNEEYGILGSNKSTEEEIKLFPRNSKETVERIQELIKEATGKTMEVMVYGDGAFKDPVGMIWELADPVVSPGYTKGLDGTPSEVKIKYLADNTFKDLKGDELKNALKEHISHKSSDLVGKMESQGTTPRRLTDLIGSLCDLTSGSGDKGTPIIYIKGYFDNYSK